MGAGGDSPSFLPLLLLRLFCFNSVSRSKRKISSSRPHFFSCSSFFDFSLLLGVFHLFWVFSPSFWIFPPLFGVFHLFLAFSSCFRPFSPLLRFSHFLGGFPFSFGFFILLLSILTFFCPFSAFLRFLQGVFLSPLLLLASSPRSPE